MADTFDINELHWLLDIVQSIDVGVVVLDRDYNVEVWNSFMENHSGVSAEQASRHSLFELFPEIDQSWFTHKVETAVMLGTRAFTIWEQRPNLVHFKSYQPITGLADEMYQNVTILPLRSATGKTDHVCLIIYDVTGVAVNKRQLESANTKLQELALRDGLTGLLNRRYWESCLEREFARHQRYDSPVSLVIFDIDHFKRVNDTYGHQTGDEVIRSVAEITSRLARETDFAGRYGGEEFVVLLPGTHLEGAAQFAERLRQAVEQQVLDYQGSPLSYTISLGVATISDDMANYQILLERADKALYASKEQGRNRVTLAPQA
ncbi:diguanylate cyclase [Halopseudomonas aestusnigri]|jgi:diguanylate cyclase (GGDEF)-like protein|uniref:sensor domain-containing diguanylate cyclase n=1 Tax=Halopseudomonas TaxID=2901189 RepID=UPI000C952035|nr:MULTISPECIES: sensor domain-containing diguanylate cyclase [Halopseudomonas]MAK75343.1 diguanylate cyclase [Pseudomonadales bacterium]HBT58538.1 diguanylate cyclase [Pseudomonas sp.]MAP77613.1 diguanylate cyclase [Pseudomonadales bacterium]MCK5532843.1 diguanylate cyclase [Halopseudomonas aestusnigri]MDL2199814.1 diguanylate cyclase [Halopseudomonas aestusnigri]|tara:strand:+ start:21226 stop:22185 length:960 start_codon:yes stop_codon:yes gene_type:complete